jgi:hypothetical protein
VTRRTRGPDIATVLRDVGSFLLGWVLIYQQALFVDPAKVNPNFLWVALACITTPVGAETLVRLRAFLGGTSPSGSDSRPEASSSSSSSTSADGDGDD